MMRTVVASGPVTSSLPWAESLGLTLSFFGDGLSLLFAIVITAIGALIVLFSSRYFEGDPRAGRFLATLFAFMGSMLGVVLADNIFALFVFWELTGFTSFLLIGFDQERPRIAQRGHPGVRGYGYGWNGSACRGGTHRVSAGSHEFSALLSRGAWFENQPHITGSLHLFCWRRSRSPRKCRFTSGCQMQWPRRRPLALIFIRPPW